MFEIVRIPCIVLAFHELDVVRQTLDALGRFGQRLSITVVENRSPTTDSTLRPFFLTQLAEGRIDRYILFRDNITNNALEVVFDNRLVPIGSSCYVLLTDGDVVPDNPHWLDEQLRILERHPDLLVCGVPLSEENLPTHVFPDAPNWVPPPVAVHEDYIETSQSGVHLWLIRAHDLRRVLRYRRATGKRFVDGTFAEYARHAGRKWGLTRRAVARHLTWDLYADSNHPYTQLKLTKTFQQTWYHNRYAPCDIWIRGRKMTHYPLVQWCLTPFYNCLWIACRIGCGLVAWARGKSSSSAMTGMHNQGDYRYQEASR